VFNVVVVATVTRLHAVDAKSLERFKVGRFHLDGVVVCSKRIVSHGLKQFTISAVALFYMSVAVLPCN